MNVTELIERLRNVHAIWPHSALIVAADALEAQAQNLAAAERERDELIGMREEVLHYQREFHRLRDERDEAVALLRDETVGEPYWCERRDSFLAKVEAKP